MSQSTAGELEREHDTYERLLENLSDKEGKFALVAGDELLGIFDTYADALAEGYRKRGLDPFLVKRISAVEVIANFSRDFAGSCLTSQAP